MTSATAWASSLTAAHPGPRFPCFSCFHLGRYFFLNCASILMFPCPTTHFPGSNQAFLECHRYLQRMGSPSSWFVSDGPSLRFNWKLFWFLIQIKHLELPQQFNFHYYDFHFYYSAKLSDLAYESCCIIRWVWGCLFLTL